jgi:hypothetical protein
MLPKIGRDPLKVHPLRDLALREARLRARLYQRLHDGEFLIERIVGGLVVRVLMSAGKDFFRWNELGLRPCAGLRGWHVTPLGRVCAGLRSQTATRAHHNRHIQPFFGTSLTSTSTRETSHPSGASGRFSTESSSTWMSSRCPPSSKKKW